MAFNFGAWVGNHPIATALAMAFLGLVGWIIKLDKAMRTTPPEALKFTQGPWDEDELRKTYARMQEKPRDWSSHLPPKPERRYAIVGGSGLLGWQIILHLLSRGHPPSAIRIVDFRAPFREGSPTGAAADIDFAQADVTSQASVTAAFAKPWDPSVASLPLTVFHTVAIILPSERHPLLYERSSKINVTGAAHVVAAAREAGAGIFIATSSSSVTLRPTVYFNAPWSRWPTNYVQIMTEEDSHEPARPNHEFFANYARSKSEGERLVCAADTPGGVPSTAMRTGVIRPGMPIYGGDPDVMVTPVLKETDSHTFSAPWVQAWIHAGNAALAHLNLEAALLGPYVDNIAGRPFVVTDPGPALRFEDFYLAVRTLSKRSPKFHYPSPATMYVIASMLEAYCVSLQYLPFLRRFGLREPGWPIYLLQPACFTACSNCIVVDAKARLPPAEGGIGYEGVCTTMEGVCMEIVRFNRNLAVEKTTEKTG